MCVLEYFHKISFHDDLKNKNKLINDNFDTIFHLKIKKFSYY